MRAHEVDLELQSLLEAIFQRFRYDFRGYAQASLRRRIAAALPLFGCASVGSLQEKILHHPAAFPELLRLLTAQSNDLFRDPGFFRVLRSRVLPELRTSPSLKVWVAGCGAGEDLYSLAIVLDEEGFSHASLLATDINPEALQRAEAGVFPLDQVASCADNYQRAGGKRSLGAYYTAAFQTAVVDRSLRARVTFSDHSLATDDALAQVDLVLCRTVLLSFDRPLQDRALGLFATSLRRRGFLGLGARDSLQFSRHAPDFQPFAHAERWYRRA